MEMMDLRKTVDYQTGSIVSKEILKADSGTVTLFAFDSGQGLSEHVTPFDALVYIVDGKAKVTISGSDHQLSEGQMVHMPANHPHALLAEEKFKMLLIMIKR